MLFIPRGAPSVRALKVLVRNHLPSVSSSHLSEALAAAASARTHAALVTTPEPGTAALTLDDTRFLARLDQLGHHPVVWPGFDSIARSSWHDSPHRSVRSQAWRNMLAAAINAGLSQGLFDLSPTGNFWPGAANSEYGVGESWCYDVATPDGIPARAYVQDISFGELALHVAYWPAHDDRLRASNAEFDAGEAFAVGWLERTKGAWLQADRRGGGPGLSIRRHLQDRVANTLTIPMGYQDHGKFFL